MHVRDEGFDGSATGELAVGALGELATQRLIQREKTKRLLIGTVAALFVVGAIVMLYAPAEKAQLGYIIGAVLIVLSLAVLGASRVILRMPGIELSAQSASGQAANSRRDKEPGDKKPVSQ